MKNNGKDNFLRRRSRGKDEKTGKLAGVGLKGDCGKKQEP